MKNKLVLVYINIRAFQICLFIIFSLCITTRGPSLYWFWRIPFFDFFTKQVKSYVRDKTTGI